VQILALIIVSLASLTSIIRLVTSLKKDALSPTVFWHAFLLLLLYSRLLTILLVDLDFRWVSGASRDELAVAAIVLTAISLIATLSAEFGMRLGGGEIEKSNDFHLSYSVPLSTVTLLVGAAAFGLYFSMLGGISHIINDLARSKSVGGAGVVTMLGSLVWVAPAMLLSNQESKSAWNKSVIAVAYLLAAIGLVSLYGRAAPLVWGVLLSLMAFHYCSARVRLGRIVTVAVIVFVLFLLFKAYRLSISWDHEILTAWELMRFYGGSIVADGGEQAITDMSLRVLLWGESDFPLGSFWQRWLVWPIDLLPSVLFPFDINSPTVGRQMYWWATSRFDVDSGVPIFGFISAYKTGSIGFVIIVYFFFGYLVGKGYRNAASKEASGVVAYLMALCVMLFDTGRARELCIETQPFPSCPRFDQTLLAGQ